MIIYFSKGKLNLYLTRKNSEKNLIIAIGIKL